MSLLRFNQRLVPVNIVHDALVSSVMPPCLFRRWQFTIHLIIILVNMSLFRYFGREKVKAVGDNNNLEVTKKDDDQSNATGVAKSTAEIDEMQESSRKRCHTFQELWKTRRPWLKFDKKENACFQGSTLTLARSPLESKIDLVESEKCQLTKNTNLIRKVIFYSLESTYVAFGVQTGWQKINACRNT